MLDNIRAHSFMVARVAEALVHSMASAKLQPLPDLDLVLSGALLHDIAKTPCLEKQCHHAKVGRDICVELGYPEIGEIVREHVVLYDYDRHRYLQGNFMAKEIVYYADKRVLHDSIVSLEQRLDYIIDNYGNADEKRHDLIRDNFRLCQNMEEFLFSFIEFPANDLKQYVSSDSFEPTDPGSP